MEKLTKKKKKIKKRAVANLASPHHKLVPEPGGEGAAGGASPGGKSRVGFGNGAVPSPRRAGDAQGSHSGDP